MKRLLLVAAASALIAVPPTSPPAVAASNAQPTVGGRSCAQTPARTARRGILGGLGRAVGNRLLGSNEVTRQIANYIPANEMLADALINLLDCDEQQKAAQATEAATVQAERGGAGASASWASQSRAGVTGTSTVTAVGNTGADGRRCMTVTDVVIIDGEETTVPKQLCRTPPSTRYARV